MTLTRGRPAVFITLAFTVLWLLVGPPAHAENASGPSSLAQTQLEEIEPPRAGLSGGTAEMTLVVDPLEFSGAWLEVQRSASRQGGSILSATAETVDRDGRTVSIGIAEMRIPANGLPEVLGDMLAVGTLVDARFAGDTSDVVTVVVTVTESELVTSGPAPEGSMISRALDTAGNVVLTIASVVIVVAAAVVPIGLMILLGYAAWRWIRSHADVDRRSEPAAVTDRSETHEDALVD